MYDVGALKETTLRNLPIGIQNFEKLREEHFLYVDKTQLIYRLVTKYP